MAAPKPPPSGSSASAPGDPRPRAQVSYEGEDEFSVMSLDPDRRTKKGTIDLEPTNPGEKKQVKVDDLKPKSSGMLGFIRKIFDR